MEAEGKSLGSSAWPFRKSPSVLTKAREEGRHCRKKCVDSRMVEEGNVIVSMPSTACPNVPTARTKAGKKGDRPKERPRN
jgi:hypothetical protein